MSAVAKKIGVGDIAKKLIADPVNRIELDAFVNERLRVAISALSLSNFLPTSPLTSEEFSKRTTSYVTAISDLQVIAILLARWLVGSLGRCRAAPAA